MSVSERIAASRSGSPIQQYSRSAAGLAQDLENLARQIIGRIGLNKAGQALRSRRRRSVSRSRDLSGFGANPKQSEPPKPEPTIPPPPRRAGDTKAVRRTRKTSKSGSGIKRITLSLPTSVASRLKATTRREATYYLDVILNALVDHVAEVQAGHGSPRRIGELEVARPRRKRPPGRTQIPLNIPAEALAQIDKAAADSGLDRSGFVADLLDRAL